MASGLHTAVADETECVCNNDKGLQSFGGLHMMTHVLGGGGGG